MHMLQQTFILAITKLLNTTHMDIIVGIGKDTTTYTFMDILGATDMFK